MQKIAPCYISEYKGLIFCDLCGRNITYFGSGDVLLASGSVTERIQGTFLSGEETAAIVATIAGILQTKNVMWHSKSSNNGY